MKKKPPKKPSKFDVAAVVRGLKKEYTFIDTKAIIKQLIDDNEKDVYYPDDTHWSYKASAKIFEETKFN